MTHEATGSGMQSEHLWRDGCVILWMLKENVQRILRRVEMQYAKFFAVSTIAFHPLHANGIVNLFKCNQLFSDVLQQLNVRKKSFANAILCLAVIGACGM